MPAPRRGNTLDTEKSFFADTWRRNNTLDIRPTSYYTCSLPLLPLLGALVPRPAAVAAAPPPAAPPPVVVLAEHGVVLVDEAAARLLGGRRRRAGVPGDEAQIHRGHRGGRRRRGRAQHRLVGGASSQETEV